MKRFILLCSTLLWASNLLSDPDCLDNSWHLAKRNDSKEYHSVACNCPCSKQKKLADRNRCFVCQHYHYPRPLFIIKDSKSTLTESQRTALAIQGNTRRQETQCSH